MLGQRIKRRISGRQHFQIKTLVQSARPELRRKKLFRDRVEVKISGFFRQSLLKSEQFLEGKVEPHARRCSAEQIVMDGEDAPDFPRIFYCCSPSLHTLKR